MATTQSYQCMVAELVRDATFSSCQARRVADAILRARWGCKPRTRADYLAAARRRQRGAGLASPLLTVTDEQLAQADADIGWRLDRDGRAAARAERDAEFGVAPFRLTGFGLERIR